MKNFVLILLVTTTQVNFASGIPASLKHFKISPTSISFTWGICPSPTPSLRKNDYGKKQKKT